MNPLRRLIGGWHRLIREFTKFGIIGLINTGVDYGIFNALYPIGPLKAQCISTVVAATSSYFMNRHWTFRHRTRSGIRREYLLFFLFNAIGLAIALAVLGITKYGLGYDTRFAGNVAKTIGLVLGTVFRFWSYSRWVFLHPEDALYATEDDETEAEAQAQAEARAEAQAPTPARSGSRHPAP